MLDQHFAGRFRFRLTGLNSSYVNRMVDVTRQEHAYNYVYNPRPPQDGIDGAIEIWRIGAPDPGQQQLQHPHYQARAANGESPSIELLAPGSNSSPQGRAHAVANAPPQPSAPEVRLTVISPEDAAAIERLQQLGFSRRAAMEAFQVSDKDSLAPVPLVM